MLHNYYAIFDKRSKKFHPMFPAQDEHQARRMVTMSMKPDTMLYNFPQDYDLRHILIYDDETGGIEGSTNSYVAALTDLKPGYRATEYSMDEPETTSSYDKASLEESIAHQLSQEAHNDK